MHEHPSGLCSPFKTPDTTPEDCEWGLQRVMATLSIRQPEGVVRAQIDAISSDPEARASYMEYLGVRASAEYDAWQTVHIDEMTGLLNEKAWRIDLEKRIAELETGQSGASLGVLFCDLDRFKHLNDTAGHNIGNVVITEVAKTLKSNMRTRNSAPDGMAHWLTSPNAQDIHQVSHWGGDEYAVTLRFAAAGEDSDAENHGRRVNVLSPEERLETVKGRLTMAIGALAARLEAEYIEADTPGVTFGISIGAAIWQPGQSAEALMKKAEDDMYEVKERRHAEYLQSLPPSVREKIVAALGTLNQHGFRH
ncbi:MAG TPA: GGDEF domain-containing protein [Candidatus Saccharimonadales bacterium]|nr:GGDEF domain-containing protein [Candidatus Saccharimonadales bacterium]